MSMKTRNEITLSVRRPMLCLINLAVHCAIPIIKICNKSSNKFCWVVIVY